MPRYHFHIRRKGELIEDEEGSDLPDFAAAEQEARESAREIAGEALRNGLPLDGDSIEVTDGDGRLLSTLPLLAMLD